MEPSNSWWVTEPWASSHPLPLLGGDLLSKVHKQALGLDGKEIIILKSQ